MDTLRKVDEECGAVDEDGGFYDGSDPFMIDAPNHRPLFDEFFYSILFFFLVLLLHSWIMTYRQSAG